MRFGRLVGLASVSLTILMPVSPASADGCKFPEYAVAEMPKIPHQRAIVVWRDGVETLAVESHFESESHDVGWVLPLPAEPIALDVADPGMLTSLASCFQPQITHDLSHLWRALLAVFAGTAGIAAVLVFSRDPERRRRNLLALLVFLLFLTLLLSVFLPSLGTGGSRGGPSKSRITVSSVQRLGNYDVTVLRAADSEALSEWLRENGLKQLDTKAREIVNDYIARKWCFLVAQLRRDNAGPGVPHPILATFHAESPVYPMKMTALANSTTRVELFVISDRQAAADGFRLAASDRYGLESGGPDKSALGGQLAPYYSARSTGLIIGNPDAGRLMWNGCVVTKLAADLKPSMMTSDVELRLEDLRVHRDHFFSPRARREIAWSVALAGGIVVLLACAIIFRALRRPRRKDVLALFVLVAITGLGASITYACLPTIPVRTGERIHPFFMVVHSRILYRAASVLIVDGVLHSGMTDAEFAGFPDIAVRRDLLRSRDLTNPATGEKIRMERSPGNFSVRRLPGKTYFCLYDRNGREMRIDLPSSAHAGTKPSTGGG